METLKYQPTQEEKEQGLYSSVNSKGVVGLVNRFMVRVFKQGEVDIVGFVSDLWQRKLIGPPEDF